MKIEIQIDDSLDESEVIIRAKELNSEVAKIQKALSGMAAHKGEIVFEKNETEYYFPVENILFFETDGDKVFAHTVSDLYLVRKKLYELEEILPTFFLRVSKSAILNTKKVYGLTKNLSASSKVEFSGTGKVVYVSRNFYKTLKEKIGSDSKE